MKTTMEIFEQQKVEPIYLTNGCGEDTGQVDEITLQAMGLSYGAAGDDGYDAIGHAVHPGASIPTDYAFVPLTPRENLFIGEDCQKVGPAEIQFGYSVLYWGRKWLCPHAVYHFRNDATRERWGTPIRLEIDLLDREMVTKTMNKHLEFVRPRIEALGGHVMLRLDTDHAEDRHEALLLIPPEAVEAKLYNMPPSFDRYQAWLIGYLTP